MDEPDNYVMIRFRADPDISVLERLRSAIAALGGTTLEVDLSEAKEKFRLREKWLLSEQAVELQLDAHGVYIEGRNALIDRIREVVPPD